MPAWLSCLVPKDIGRGTAPTKKDAKRTAALSSLKALGVNLVVGPKLSSHHPGQLPLMQQQPQQQGQQQLKPPASQLHQGAGGPSGFNGPPVAPPPSVDQSPVDAGTAASVGTSHSVGTSSHPANDATMYRLMNMYSKENLVFTVLKDEGLLPNRCAGGTAYSQPVRIERRRPHLPKGALHQGRGTVERL